MHRLGQIVAQSKGQHTLDETCGIKSWLNVSIESVEAFALRLKTTEVGHLVEVMAMIYLRYLEDSQLLYSIEHRIAAIPTSATKLLKNSVEQASFHCLY